MLILAFETSAKAGSVALWEDSRLLGEFYNNTGLTHSQTLMVMAQQLLESCGRRPKDVEAVAVAAGPGSFTGVRIGVAAAKGFAWGAELPLYGVSTLESMALQLGIRDGLIMPVMDARRQQVYNALFRFQDGNIERLTPDRAISLEDLEKELTGDKEPVFLVGDGSILCYNTLEDKLSRLVLPPEHRMHQRAAGVALAASRAISQGQSGDAAALQPNYLRLSQAERERLAKKENKEN